MIFCEVSPQKKFQRKGNRMNQREPRELDALVGTQYFGWQGRWDVLPQFSKNLDDAWKIVAVLLPQFHFQLEDHEETFYCTFTRRDTEDSFGARGTTPMLAICDAALHITRWQISAHSSK